MARILFVTGTDTGVGKTVASVALLRAFQRRNQVALAMKPVASGCQMTRDGLRNDDALRLQAAASRWLSYEQINPYAFAPPIAPHIAAELAGVEIDPRRIRAHCMQLATAADVVLVEGVGGWLVPVSATETMADVARELEADVILVVGIRLGCLNHALLTAQAIVHAGLPLCGWIANCIAPDTEYAQENIAALAMRLPAPCLGVMPYLDSGDLASCMTQIDLDKLA